MKRTIDNPVAEVAVIWLRPSQGGRTSGPPSAPVYAATGRFELNGAAVSDTLSILLEPLADNLDTDDPMRHNYKLGFLVPELAGPYLHPGANFDVLEGPKIVAHGFVNRVLVGL